MMIVRYSILYPNLAWTGPFLKDGQTLYSVKFSIINHVTRIRPLPLIMLGGQLGSVQHVGNSHLSFRGLRSHLPGLELGNAGYNRLEIALTRKGLIIIDNYLVRVFKRQGPSQRSYPACCIHWWHMYMIVCIIEQTLFA